MYRHRNIPWIENIFKIIKTLVFQMRLFEGSLEYSHHAIKKVTPNWASGLLSHDDPGLMSLPSDEVARIAGLPRADVPMWPTPNCGRKSQQNQNKQLEYNWRKQPSNTQHFSMCDCLKLGIPQNLMVGHHVAILGDSAVTCIYWARAFKSLGTDVLVESVLNCWPFFGVKLGHARWPWWAGPIFHKVTRNPPHFIPESMTVIFFPGAGVLASSEEWCNCCVRIMPSVSALAQAFESWNSQLWQRG